MKQLLTFFNCSHLPPFLQDVSAPMQFVAKKMDELLPDCEEKRAGMRKLLEAKDCFVRARTTYKADTTVNNSSH
ncbi:hypothetical protein [Shewanella algae]|uniref:hypothetical protein n=1 Tax=Shewanella algae TaxID=38313 RepID=UPI0031F5BBD3